VVLRCGRLDKDRRGGVGVGGRRRAADLEDDMEQNTTFSVLEKMMRMGEEEIMEERSDL